MIVQDKENQLDYYGAVQFHTNHKKMSLAKYPGVTMKRAYYEFPLPDDIKGKIGACANKDKDFYYHDIALADGDWLVTDKEGQTRVYTDKQFKKVFVKKEGEEV